MKRLLLLGLLLVSGGCATTGDRAEDHRPVSAEQVELRRLRDLADAADATAEGQRGAEPAASQQVTDRASLRCQLAALLLAHVDSPALSRRERLDYTEEALRSADAAIALDSERGEAHYHRAVAIGRILEFSRIPNPSMIKHLDAAGQRAHELDPGFDQAGPCLLLALLYSQAPAWPVGPELAGEIDVIEELFEESIELAPGGVENHVSYGEWLFDEARDADALAQAQRASQLLAGPTPTLGSRERTALSERVKELFEHLLDRQLDQAEALAKAGKRDEAVAQARAVSALLVDPTTILTGDARRAFEQRLEALLEPPLPR